MDEIERLKEDVRQGRISVERLIEVITSQQRRLDAAKRHLARLEKRAAQSERTDARR